jgi:hypothetical protein
VKLISHWSFVAFLNYIYRSYVVYNPVSPPLLLQPIAAPYVENQEVDSHLKPAHVESHPCHVNRIQDTPLHQSNGGRSKKLQNVHSRRLRLCQHVGNNLPGLDYVIDVGPILRHCKAAGSDYEHMGRLTVFSNHSLKVKNIGSIPASRSKPFERPLIFKPASFLTSKEPQAANCNHIGHRPCYRATVKN